MIIHSITTGDEQMCRADDNIAILGIVTVGLVIVIVIVIAIAIAIGITITIAISIVITIAIDIVINYVFPTLPTLFLKFYGYITVKDLPSPSRFFEISSFVDGTAEIF